MARYLVSGGTGNWNSTTNWSDTSGGASGFSVPTSTDDVIMDALSAGAAITVNVSSNAKSIDATNYTGTLTSNQLLTVAGAVTLGSGMTVSGTNTLLVNTTATLTSNGVIWSGNLTFAGANQIYTLADDWNVTGNVSQGSGASGTVNGNNIYISGNLTTGAAIADGTTTYRMVGTGTLSGTGSLRHPLIINTSGTITIGATVYGGTSITYVAGTIAGTGLLTLSVTGGVLALDTGGMVWPGGITINLNATITLSSDLNTMGLAYGGGTSNCTINGFNINNYGNLTASLNTTMQGTTVLNAVGTGTWATAGASANLRLDTNIMTTGTTTFGSSFKYHTGTFKYISGTTISTGSTLTLGGFAVMDTSGMTWSAINCIASNTVTINSPISCTGTLSITTVSVVFSGTAGWTAGTFTMTTGNQTLQSGLTYVIENSMIGTGLASNTGVFQSSSSVANANLILKYGATQDNAHISATRIDSSGGQTIYTRKGALTDSINWALTDYPRTKVSAF